MTTITASYNVIPNQATPKGRLWLSESDQIVRWSHTPTIYIYKAKHDQANIERMRESLSQILVFYYPVAGRLSIIKGGRMELDCNGKGVTLVQVESTKTLAEYGDFSPTEPINELIPKVDYGEPIHELPLLLVQLTRFHGDQGLAIGVAWAHPLGDGYSATRFINSWAKLARGDSLDLDEMPFLDRTILKSLNPSSAAPCFDHPELKPLPRVLGSSDSTIEQKKKTTSTLLKLTSEQVEKLKKEANDESQMKETGSRPYSRFEAIAAHVWRCASKARELDDNQPTLLWFSADIRNRLNPPLPRNYLGNALAPTVTPTCYVGEIISNPLSYGAQKTREAVERVTNEYIRSQWDFIRGQEQMDCMRPNFFERGERSDAHFYGNPNLSLTSWMSMPLYEADFGWGKPMYCGPGAVCPYDRALIFLSPDGDGSITVIMHFQIAHMQLFKKFFFEHVATVV